MDGAVGASVEDLRALAVSIAAGADGLENLRARLSAELGNAPWSGCDADIARSVWNTEMVVGLYAGAECLREASRTLQREADQQEHASAAATGATPAAAGSGAHRRGDQKIDDPKLLDADRGIGIGGFRPFSGRYEGKTDYRDTPLYAADPARPSSDPIDPSDAVQGNVGDCYLIAALSAMASTERGRQAIRDAVTDNGDGTFTVAFADGQRVTVDDDFYTENGKNRYAPASGDIWAPLIEKAFAAREGGYQVVGEGGSSSRVFTLLGLAGEQHAMANVSEEELTAILTSGSPVALDATMKALGSNRSGNHAISVLGASRDEDGRVVVELRNPWGIPIGGDLEMQNDGIFQMSLDEVRRTFYAIEYVAP